jgi:hypothetical protein
VLPERVDLLVHINKNAVPDLGCHGDQV